MKFLCVQCDEGMRLEEAEGPEDGSVTIVFRCPSCATKVAMLTNPAETQLVRALDVRIGGRTETPAPLTALRENLDQAPLLWTEEAEARLLKVPGPMRSAVRTLVERYATEQGCREVGPQTVAEARQRFGK